jgi:hypothetical protein
MKTKKITNPIGTFLSIIIIFVIFLPTVQWLYPFVKPGALYGYTPNIPAKPNDLIKSFFNKSLQTWVEKYFDANLGFRDVLVRSFNEMHFFLFNSNPNQTLFKLGQHGLFNDLSLNNINNDIISRIDLEKKYQIEAKKLFEVQKKLKAQGKYFEVVIASSKSYIYPEDLGSRFLKGGSVQVFDRTASFGNILKSEGVNIYDSGPGLRNFVATSHIDSHPDSGVHWNFYSACIVAKELLKNIDLPKFQKIKNISCGTPSFELRMNYPDVDGLMLLNLWTDANVLKKSPYPAITPDKTTITQMKPNIVFIGDSFSDQIRFSIKASEIYSKIVFSSYFMRRELENAGTNIKESDDGNENQDIIKSRILKDISESDIVILEMVDYNIPKLGYGFADYFLAH